MESRAWKKSLRKVHDNPDYIELQVKAIMKELRKNNPDTNYLREKTKHIDDWLDEIDKFHYGARR